MPDKDPAALADAIERYVRDPAFTAEIARKGRQRICESFNVTAVVSQLLERILPPQGSPEGSRSRPERAGELAHGGSPTPGHGDRSLPQRRQVDRSLPANRSSPTTIRGIAWRSRWSTA